MYQVQYLEVHPGPVLNLFMDIAEKQRAGCPFHSYFFWPLYILQRPEIWMALDCLC